MATLDVEPKSGNVGDKLKVSGSGFGKTKNYDLLFGGSIVGSFRSKPTGAVPAGTILRVPEVPTSGVKGELGTTFTIDAQTASLKDARASTGFELQASVISEAKSAYLGDRITVHGKGLLPNVNYQISLISPGYIPFAAGIFDSGVNGSATASIAIPDYVGAGPFQVDLLNRPSVYPAIRRPAPIRILGFSYKTLTAGKPKRTVGAPDCPVRVSIPFRNNSAITFLPVVYAIIYDTHSQPLQLTSSGAGLAPLSTSDVVFCLPNMQKGQYKIEVFATTGTGRVLSKVFRFDLTI